MGTLRQDLRYGFRMLLKNPGFALVAVITLALGIGANTCIFSVVNAVLLRPLPYKNPEQIVRLWEDPSGKGLDQNPVAPGNFADWRRQNTVFQEIAAFIAASCNVTGGERPERIEGARVSPSFFPLLGVTPMLGRTFLPEEEQPGDGRVVVLSQAVWQRRFGSDPNLIGKTLKLDGESHTVIGILPSQFKYPWDVELWVPFVFDAGQFTDRGSHCLEVIARLKPGVTVQRARSEMQIITERLKPQYPAWKKSWGVSVVPMLDQVVGNIRPTLLVLLGAVGFVLLIACANVANFLLARGTARQKEIAIRAALGADRIRLRQQLLTECLLLCFFGGVLGWLFASWFVGVVRAVGTDNFPRFNEISLDGPVFMFTLGISVTAGMIFGLTPALQVSKPGLNDTLKEGGRSSGGLTRNRFRSVLVVSEVALSLVLLVGAGLMILSFLRLLKVNPGFNAKNVVTMELLLPQYKYPERRQQVAFIREALQPIETLPGVRSAGATITLPMVWQPITTGFTIEGRSTAPEEVLTANYDAITPNYFLAMGIPLLQGRFFSERDTDKMPRVVIVSEALARKFFPGESPLGKQIRLGGSTPREIVGVAGNVRQQALDIESRPHIYEPYMQASAGLNSVNLVLRTLHDPTSLVKPVQNEIFKVDNDQPANLVRMMEQVLANSVAQRRLSMLLLGLFASGALILASVGIYGVIAYTVTQRTHEIGIRIALGAEKSDVLTLFVKRGMVLVITGLVIGLAGSLALTHLLASQLYAVSAIDPLTFFSVALLLAGVALLACYIPARKATKLDPIAALRYE
jgi:putative ABC transport system permease protein